ncbi:MAG: transposase [Pyrinomonadaceae bacterium MAG19_C2-C3]|nr:transposase [Pyrinomonadaceae bacterium MAG19_C2-C3]
MLPDRTAETSTIWLQKHTEVRVVSRDRASAYAEAITKALPHAVQVADRWHLLKNATEMLDRLLQQRGRAVREASKAMRDEWSAQVTDLPAPTTRYEERKAEHRDRRLARYEEVIALRRQGAGIRAISRHLHLSRNTVKKYVRAEAFPERRP